MFREDNTNYYKPENTSLNHADSIKRPLKKKAILAEIDKKILIANHRLRVTKPDDTVKRQRLEKEINKLQRQRKTVCEQTICHKTIHKRKKLKPDFILDYCRKAITDATTSKIRFLVAEDIAYQLQTPVHLVKQAFVTLNKEGLLSQAYHHYPHDAYRPGDSAWSADIYYIHNKNA